ncbi:MAG: hypothetical protein MUF71_13080 [Candidatus Kapabacteria bacterium]|jgi:hypothetical protein|nr:hypothetical protein [Candidatus Kapabacteria bacterium]
MSAITREAHVHEGRISLEDLPFAENTAVTVTVVVKPIFQPDMDGWREARILTAGITGNWADDIQFEREER